MIGSIRLRIIGCDLWACSSVWLERTPDKREVDGSTPSRPTRQSIEQSASRSDVYRHARFRARFFGGVAQLGERLPCTQEAIGSNPFTSTIFHKWSGGERVLTGFLAGRFINVL